jgi:hypothetical protein
MQTKYHGGGGLYLTQGTFCTFTKIVVAHFLCIFLTVHDMVGVGEELQGGVTISSHLSSLP